MKVKEAAVSRKAKRQSGAPPGRRDTDLGKGAFLLGIQSRSNTAPPNYAARLPLATDDALGTTAVHKAGEVTGDPRAMTSLILPSMNN